MTTQIANPDPFSTGGWNGAIASSSERSADSPPEPGERIEADDDEAFANIHFDPLETAEIERRLSAEEWKATTTSLGQALRLSAVIVGKTKCELVKSTRELDRRDEDGVMDLIDWLAGSRKVLQAYADLLEMAHTRLLVGASVIVVEQNRASAI